MTQQQFEKEFNENYSEKIGNVIASLKAKFQDTYSFEFDEVVYEYKEGEYEAIFTISVKDPYKDGASSLRFTFTGHYNRRSISIWGNLYTSTGDGFGNKDRLFIGFMEDFSNLDLEDLILKKTKAHTKLDNRIE